MANVSRETSEREWRRQCEALTAGLRLLAWPLSERQRQQFRSYLKLLLEWNRHVNLFSRHDVPRLAERHLLESVAWVRALPEPLASPLLDLGSGAGFPGVPLAVLFPQLHVVLVESRKKRALFLQRVVRELELGASVTVVPERVELLAESPEHLEHYRSITARAVAPLSRLLAWCDPLLAPRGRLFAFKGDRLKEELQSLRPSLQKGLQFEAEVIDYAVWRNVLDGPQRIIRRVVCLKKRSGGEGQDGTRSI